MADGPLTPALRDQIARNLHGALCACGSLDNHDDQVTPDDGQPIRADFERAVTTVVTPLLTVTVALNGVVEPSHEGGCSCKGAIEPWSQHTGCVLDAFTDDPTGDNARYLSLVGSYGPCVCGPTHACSEQHDLALSPCMLCRYLDPEWPCPNVDPEGATYPPTKLTPAVVQANPTYWLAGPGRSKAEATLCPHGYTLVDSCPGCDCDAPNYGVPRCPDSHTGPCALETCTRGHQVHRGAEAEPPATPNQVAAWFARDAAGETVRVIGVRGTDGREVLRGRFVGYAARPQVAIKVAPGTRVLWDAALVRELPAEPDACNCQSTDGGGPWHPMGDTPGCPQPQPDTPAEVFAEWQPIETAPRDRLIRAGRAARKPDGTRHEILVRWSKTHQAWVTNLWSTPIGDVEVWSLPREGGDQR